MGEVIERRKTDKTILAVLGIVLVVQVLQGIEIHDTPILDVDDAEVLLESVPWATEKAKELAEFALAVGGLIAVVRALWKGKQDAAARED